MLRGSHSRRQIRQFARVVGLGAEFAAALALGFWGGGWLDERFDSAPWLRIVAMVLGFLLGGWRFAATVATLRHASTPPGSA